MRGYGLAPPSLGSWEVAEQIGVGLGGGQGKGRGLEWSLGPGGEGAEWQG